MTDNPIDMAIELLEYVESHGVALDIDECEHVKDTLKTYRDEYISIKKSDVPECLNLAVNQLKKFNEESKITKDSFLWILHTTVNLVARAMEVEDE